MGIKEELRWTAAKLMKVGKYAVDSAVNESLRGLTPKPYLTPLVKRELEELFAGKKIECMLIRTGVFLQGEAAVNRLISCGMQVYTIVREKWQGEPTSKHSKSNKKQNFALVEEVQSKLEKTQEDMNKLKQQNKVSTHGTKEHEHLKQFSDEPVKSSIPEVTDRKTIFIRSRL